MSDIPDEDWRYITAGVRDPEVLALVRRAYTAGGWRMKFWIQEATSQVTMPKIAPIAVLMSEDEEGASRIAEGESQQ